jgi:nucleoside-diphosphate-sugar epimerase
LISQPNLSALRSTLLHYRKIVLTGASGWLGKETADLLAEALGDGFEERLIFVSSTPKNVLIQHKVITTLGWDVLNSLSDVDLLIHFSFLNQDKANELGFTKYIAANRRIILEIDQFLNRNPGCEVLVASSGATHRFRGDINSDKSMEVYAALKLEAEQSALANIHIDTLLIMRIWNVTGSGLSLKAPYAIANFFLQGIHTSEIEVMGNGTSARTYVDAKEMMSVFILSLSKGKKITMDSGGFTISFSQLAQKIAAILDLPASSVRFTGESKEISDYIPDANPFNGRAKNLNIMLSDIDSQIKLLHAVYQNQNSIESTEIT